MKLTILVILTVFFTVSPIAERARADVPQTEKPEVEYLLNLVKTSTCKFERNGKLYDGERAYGHINRKYDHFRDKITSTESFIEYSATKSMISGRNYYIICQGAEPERTSDWLLGELKKYRESH